MLIGRDEVRQQNAVQAFDHTQKLAEYGLDVGTREDLDNARRLVTSLVSDAESEINALITSHREIDQNPYKPVVLVDGAELKYAMEVPLFRDGELTKRIDRAFSSSIERAATRPNNSVLGAKIKRELTKLAEEGRYDVAAIDVHEDGSPARIVLRDPDYVRDATAREPKTPTLNQVGSLLVQTAADGPEPLSREALGCAKTMPSTDLAAVCALVKRLVDDAKRKVAEHVVSARNSQLSPFDEKPLELSNTILFHDERLVRRSGFTKYVDRPVVIEVTNDSAIIEALRAALPADVCGMVDKTKFKKHVREAIRDGLCAVEGLPLACVSYHYPASKEPLRAVLTDPTLERIPSTLQRLYFLRGAPARPLPALPPPAPELVPPVAPELVPRAQG